MQNVICTIRLCPSLCATPLQYQDSLTEGVPGTSSDLTPFAINNHIPQKYLWGVTSSTNRSLLKNEPMWTAHPSLEKDNTFTNSNLQYWQKLNNATHFYYRATAAKALKTHKQATHWEKTWMSEQRNTMRANASIQSVHDDSMALTGNTQLQVNWTPVGDWG